MTHTKLSCSLLGILKGGDIPSASMKTDSYKPLNPYAKVGEHVGCGFYISARLPDETFSMYLDRDGNWGSICSHRNYWSSASEAGLVVKSLVAKHLFEK